MFCQGFGLVQATAMNNEVAQNARLWQKLAGVSLMLLRGVSRVGRGLYRSLWCLRNVSR